MIKDVQAVSVMYHGRKVGTLSMGIRSTCQFEYDKDWLSTGFSISPLQLPLKAGLFTADYQPFNGNFGVFEDSLPGGYGEFLLRKVLKKSGIDAQGLTPVQWLSIVGSSGMGALCYVPETKLQYEESQRSFDEMQQMALRLMCCQSGQTRMPTCSISRAATPAACVLSVFILMPMVIGW